MSHSSELNKYNLLVSVVIPTHNRAHLLGRAVSSVLGQSYGNFELIVVDDASTDNTADVIRDFHDERIRYLRHDSNLGAPAARNTGITNARGYYIGLLDDDDKWHPQKLEKQIRKFTEVSERTGLVYCGHEVRSQDGALLRTYFPQERGNLQVRLLLGTTIGSPTPLILKSCFSKTSLFDVNLKSCQDWDMWKRISEHYDFDFVPEVLAIVYEHGRQISSDFSSMIPGRTRMVEKHLSEFRRHPEILVIHLKRIGKMHCINGTWKEAIHWFFEALKVDPLQIFKIIAWLILELPMVKLFSKEKKFKKYHR